MLKDPVPYSLFSYTAWPGCDEENEKEPAIREDIYGARATKVVATTLFPALFSSVPSRRAHYRFIRCA